MARTARGTTGFVWVAAEAAMLLSVAALAQNASANTPDSALAIPAKQMITEPHLQQERQPAAPSSDCGGGLGHFLKALTSPPNPFETACGPSEDW